jgi:AcrR family transcriptional regulator
MNLPQPMITSVRPPRQDRSRASLERMLSATERLICLKRFEDVTIAEIVRRSRTSVGAFYARFEGKADLLPCLYERYDAWLGRIGERALAKERWAGLALEARVRHLARLAVIVYRKRRGIIRAMALHARAHPDALTETQREHRRAFYGQAAELLFDCREEIGRPQPEEAARFALMMLGAIAREKILFDDAPQASTLRLSDRRLATEIADAMLAYLSPVPERRSPRPGATS